MSSTSARGPEPFSAKVRTATKTPEEIRKGARTPEMGVRELRPDFLRQTRTILHSSKLKPSQIRRLVSMLSDGATLRQAAHQAHVSLQTALPFVGEEPVLPFQLFREGSRGSRDSHDGHKDGEAEPGRSREIHHLCPHTAWEDRSGRHRQTSSVVRKR